MPRPRNRPKPLHSAVDSLVGAMNGLLDTLGAAGPHLPVEMRHAPGEVAPKQRGPGKGNPKLKAALKAYWAKMKGKARAERIRKMQAGRGVKAKGAVKRTSSAKPKAAKGSSRNAPLRAPAKARKNPWASMTAEQKAERMAKMRAGRGKPKSSPVGEPRQVTLLES